jgi:hypothetical protein
MEWMDRARRYGGLIWVAFGVAFQLGWSALGRATPGLIPLVVGGVATLLGLAILLRLHPRGTWAVAWLTAVLLGLEFAGAVADRFGIFGGPGGPGISWGSWAAFVSYTALLLPGLGRPVVVLAAVLATVTEVVLSVLLVTGVQRRWVGKATAGLLGVYAVAMTWALGLDAIAVYALPSLIGGALLVSACPARLPPAARAGDGRRPVRTAAAARRRLRSEPPRSGRRLSPGRVR